jgi:tetratricopeptide (TPR) repeat protein
MADALEILITSGYKARRDGRLEDARRWFFEAVGKSSAPADQARSLTALGQIERDLGDNAQALLQYRKAVDIYRGLHSSLMLAHTLRHTGDILSSQALLEEARPCYEEALRIYREHPETPPLDLANAIRGFALLRVAAGENGPARSLWQEARSLYQAEDIQAGVDESDAQLALL